MPRRLPRVDATGLPRAGAGSRGASSINSVMAVAQLAAACRSPGLFVVTGHGVDARLLAEVRQQHDAFFALPADVKRRLRRDRKSQCGYYESDSTGSRIDQREGFNFCAASAEAFGPTRWPDSAELPRFQEVMAEYETVMVDLARRLLGGIALSIGTKPSALADLVGPSLPGLLHYPVAASMGALGDAPEEGEPEQFGTHAHVDANLLTIVNQHDIGGLEVRWGDEWVGVEVTEENAFVVNLGAMVQVLSNDEYRAPEHRVRCTRAEDGQSRNSSLLFCFPHADVSIAPLPLAAARSETGAHFREFNAGEFMHRKYLADFGDAQDISIDEFRV